MKRSINKIRKFSRLSIDAFGFKGFLGRFYGQKVLMNSLPKSGTNLLERVVQQIPYMHRRITPTLDDWSGENRNVVRKIQTLKKGEFMTAHLPAHAQLMELTCQLKIKTLFMVRDPRDIVVSHFNYVLTIDKSHPSHSYFKSLPNDEARLSAVINGVEGIVQPIWKVLDVCQSWLDAEGVLVVKFEDLIGSKGGGSDLNQLEVVRKICSHLEINLSEVQLNKICAGLYSEKALTFRKALIGNWKNVFTQKHIDEFMREAGSYLEKYGYQK